jgi:hypothetical protein
MRTAGPDDYPALRALAGAWFPAETLLDAVLYRQLLASRMILARILAAEDGPLGYYALWPLTAAAYESLRRGEKRERELGAREIVAAEETRGSVLYVADICAAPGAPALVLLRDLRCLLDGLLRAHPHITRVAAWAFSAQGARLAERLGMRPVPRNPALVQTTATSIMSRVAARR